MSQFKTQQLLLEEKDLPEELPIVEAAEIDYCEVIVLEGSVEEQAARRVA